MTDVSSSSNNVEGKTILTISLGKQVASAYMDYSMSVIISRALPDVCDGLKPVQRRILYAMLKGNYAWNRAHRKCAHIVGDVMGSYHPHGDKAIYDALVRMARSFSMLMPLVDGQGNFGSVDGDPPAAMRYTEARLTRLSHQLMEDIEKNTVDFVENYDATTQEPTVLPAAYPNLLVNGATGIAVGMATSIPPHNLSEICDACLRLIEEPDLDEEELFTIVPAPDFPTGALILGTHGAHKAFRTGRGQVTVRCCHHQETFAGREQIVITEIPYQVNKASVVEMIADLVKKKVIEGMADLRDESDRKGMRIVIVLKKNVDPELILNLLYKNTPLQSNFSVNMLALNKKRPCEMSLKTMLQAFLSFRENVIVRRLQFLLEKARSQAWLLTAYAIAVENIDEFVAIIRHSQNPDVACEMLMGKPWKCGHFLHVLRLIDWPDREIEVGENWHLSQDQAKAILNLRLQRLTALGRDDVEKELKELTATMETLLDHLSKRSSILKIMTDELTLIKKEYATPRRSKIIEAADILGHEDLIKREDVLLLLTKEGYIKRTPLADYQQQKHGGKGRMAVTTKDEDFVITTAVSHTHAPVLLFTSRGRVYRSKTWQLPHGSFQARGRPVVNFFPLAEDEIITTMMPEVGSPPPYVFFVTKKGKVRRNAMADFERVFTNGKIAMKVQGNDDIVAVVPCYDGQDILVMSKRGQYVRFPVENVRVFKGRSSTGVRGIRLSDDDEVISMIPLKHQRVSVEERDAYLKRDSSISKERKAEIKKDEEIILSLTSQGFGKRTSALDYRITKRGGKGSAAMKMTPKGGDLVKAFPVNHQDELILTAINGRTMRCMVKSIRKARRRTKGVIVFRERPLVSVVRIVPALELAQQETPTIEQSLDLLLE